MDLKKVGELIETSNSMDFKPFLELASGKIVTEIKRRTTEEIIKTFEIQNKFTPEEEQRIIEYYK